MGFVEEFNLGPIPLGEWTNIYQSLGYEADGESYEFNWKGNRLVEWDRFTKQEVWSWNPFDFFSFEEFDQYGGTWYYSFDVHDWMHSNAFYFDTNNNSIYMSHRHLSRITKIAYPSGEVIWNMGREMPSGDVTLGNEIGFSFQHGLQRLDNGNIVTFDNGNLSEVFLGTDYPISRALEIEINQNQSSIVWQYSLPENLFGFASGNAQKLDNGNYLSTTIGGAGTSLEVNQNGDEIWEANYNLQIPDGLVYRAMRIPGIFPIAYSVTFPQMNDCLLYTSDAADE